MSVENKGNRNARQLVEKASGPTDDEKKQGMQGPSPLSRLMQLRERTMGGRPHRKVILPTFAEEVEHDEEVKSVASISIIALTDDELLEARLSAIKYLIEKKGMAEWLLETGLGQDMLGNELQCQYLYLALRRPESLVLHYANSVSEIRMYFEPDVRLALWEEYTAFQHERNPLKHIFDDKELEEIVSALGKTRAEQSKDVLTFYDSATLRSIIRSLANLLVTRTKQLYSLTTPPTD